MELYNCEEAHSETTSNSTNDGKYSMQKEDREQAARTLGVREDEIVQDVFLISRRRIEQLIFNGTDESALSFFDDIMKRTNTLILWPAQLKENAKRKKDPFIKIRGRSDDVSAARLEVLEGLHTEVGRIKLKIDVSYTVHSHIIGIGGNTIKKVMNDTECHIHFPDSNRFNPVEKSNKVSIVGMVGKVEEARYKLRELVPLVFSFDVPVLGAVFTPMEQYSAFISALKIQYDVQIFFRTRRNLNSALVQVKGSGYSYERVKEASEKLMKHIVPTPIDQIQIHTSLEISPHHHSTVRGINNCNVALIIARTGTQITFPDVNDPDIPQIKKNNVLITGSSIEKVYEALELIIGSLPVKLTFEMPASAPYKAALNRLNQRYDIRASFKYKPRGNVYVFHIKGIERNMANLYEAHRILNGNLNTPSVTAKIPSGYILSKAPSFNEWLSQAETSSKPYPSTHGRNSRSPTPLSLLSPPISSTLGAHSPPSPHVLLNPPFLQRPYSIWPQPLLPSFHPCLPDPELTCYSPTNGSYIEVTADDRDYSPIRRSPSPEPDPKSFSLVSRAAHQMRKQNAKPTELRIPTPAWAGFGVSQSNPEPSKRKSKSLEESYELSDDNEERVGCTAKNGCKSHDYAAISNILESMGSTVIDSISNVADSSQLLDYLAAIKLEQYYGNFSNHEITEVDVFMTLTENELLDIGINTLGARKKILMLITELNNRRLYGFRRTPGCERKKMKFQWPQS